VLQIENTPTVSCSLRAFVQGRSSSAVTTTSYLNCQGIYLYSLCMSRGRHRSRCPIPSLSQPCSNINLIVSRSRLSRVCSLKHLAQTRQRRAWTLRYNIRFIRLILHLIVMCRFNVASKDLTPPHPLASLFSASPQPSSLPAHPPSLCPILFVPPELENDPGSQARHE
jgi:hypothetical protein